MIDPSPERVTWYYGEWQSAYENLDIPNLHLEAGLPTSFDSSKRNIVVLDDLMAETDERVTNLFTKKSHHCNTSVIYLVQNLFPKNKESRTISLNSQYIVVFKNPRDVSQMTTLAKQMYPGRVKFVQEAFADATSTPYGYILVDLKQDTPEDLRLRTSILPDDAVQYVYMPKVKIVVRPASLLIPRSYARIHDQPEVVYKRVTRRDDSQSSDVWSREETRSLSSDAQQDEEYKAWKGHTRIRRR